MHEDLVFGELHIDTETRTVTLEGAAIDLAKVEFDLLLTLAQHPGHVFSRQRLLERIWGSDYFGTDRVVDVRIVSLRKKLGDESRDARFIETVRGLGYRFRQS
jgi:two-component system alkaline phosphatase synthesis response regulator PhoP